MPSNRPNKNELIESVREMLESLVLPAQASSSLAYQTRVAVNILKIVERELVLGDSQIQIETESLQGLLGDMGDITELNTQLVAKIKNGDFDLDNRALLAHFQRVVLAKIAIDNPSYSTYKSYLVSGKIKNH